MRIGIFPNVTKRECAPWVQKLLAGCRRHGVEALLPAYVAESEQTIYREIAAVHYHPFSELMNTIDFAFVLGGDGTILKLARSFALAKVPVCVVNFGSLGFLMEVEPEEMEARLEAMLQGLYFLEERTLLHSELCCADGSVQELPTALNEIVVAHGNVGKMIRLDMSINGHFVQQYPGDGMIVSTATGSTGYNFSGGGPIVAPQVKCLMVSPICPHLLLKMPLVLGEDAVITFSAAHSRNAVRISIDGMRDQELPRSVTLRVKRSPYTLQMIRFDENYFYTNLFTKMTGRK